MTPLSIHSMTPDFSVSGPLRKADAPEAPATSLTACPAGQELIADWMRDASGCESDGLPSTASSDPAVGFSVAVKMAHVLLGSAGSLTLPHCVVTLAVVVDDVAVLDDDELAAVEVDDEVVVVVADVEALDEVSVDDTDPAGDVSVGEVEALPDAAAGAELSVSDDNEAAVLADDDEPPQAATHALRTAIDRRRARRWDCEIPSAAESLPQIVWEGTKDGRTNDDLRFLVGVGDIFWCVG